MAKGGKSGKLNVQVAISNLKLIQAQLMQATRKSFTQGLSAAVKSSDIGKLFTSLANTMKNTFEKKGKNIFSGIGKAFNDYVLAPIKAGIVKLTYYILSPWTLFKESMKSLRKFVVGLWERMVPQTIRDILSLAIVWKFFDKIRDSVVELMNAMHELNKSAALASAALGKSASTITNQWVGMAIRMKANSPGIELKTFTEQFQAFAAEGVDMSNKFAQKSVEAMARFSSVTGASASSLVPLIAQLIKTGKVGENLDKVLGQIASSFGSGEQAVKGLAMAQRMAMEGADFSQAAQGISVMVEALKSAGLMAEQASEILEGITHVDVEQLQGPMKMYVQEFKRGDFKNAANLLAEIQEMAKGGPTEWLGALGKAFDVAGLNQETMNVLKSGKPLMNEYIKALDKVGKMKDVNALFFSSRTDPKAMWEDFLGMLETRFYSFAVKVMPLVNGAIKFFSKVGTAAMDAFSKVFNVIFGNDSSKKGKENVSVFTQMGNTLSNLGTRVANFIKKVDWEEFAKVLKEKLLAAYEWFKEKWGAIKTFLFGGEKEGKQEKGVFQKFWEWFKTIDIQNTLTTISNTVTTVWDTLKGLFDWFVEHPFITKLLIGGILFQKLVGFDKLFSIFGGKGGGGLGAVLKGVGEALPVLGKGLARFFIYVGTAMTTGVGGIGMAASLLAIVAAVYALVGAIKWGGKDLQDFVKALGEAIATIVEGIGKAISTIIESIAKGIAILMDAAVTALAKFEKTKIGGAIADLVVSGLDNVRKFVELFGKVLDLALKTGELVTGGAGWVVNKVLSMMDTEKKKETTVSEQKPITETGIPKELVTTGVIQQRKANTTQEILLKDIATILTVIQGIQYKQLEAQMGTEQAQRIIALQMEAKSMR